MAPFTEISIPFKEGIIKKNFLWATRLWVGRRKEPILGYVPKNDEKKNSVLKGLTHRVTVKRKETGFLKKKKINNNNNKKKLKKSGNCFLGRKGKETGFKARGPLSRSPPIHGYTKDKLPNCGGVSNLVASAALKIHDKSQQWTYTQTLLNIISIA